MAVQSVTIPDSVIMQFVLLKMGMLMFETCRGFYCNIHIVNEKRNCALMLVNEIILKFIMVSKFLIKPRSKLITLLEKCIVLIRYHSS
jgi:hypothetical protein